MGRYEDAIARHGMKATCFGFDQMAVRCFQSNTFNVNVEVKAQKKKITCSAMAVKKHNKIGLGEFGEQLQAKFFLDDEEIETEGAKFNKRRGFSLKYDLRGKEFNCVSCELYMDEVLFAKGETCKDDE